jgi:hypothetical protein
VTSQAIISLAGKPSALQPFLARTRLCENIYIKLDTGSASECFAKCDADDKCAAASFLTSESENRAERMLPISFTTTECSLHKFGFVKKVQEASETDEWTSYIKSEVSKYLEDVDILTIEFPLVQQRQRLINFYNNSNALTPLQCFRACNESIECAAASFTTDIHWSCNCYFFREGEYKEAEDMTGIKMWTSFVKATVSLNQTLSGSAVRKYLFSVY